MAGDDPKALVAVADASFLIGLALIDKLALLPGLVASVYVADAVWEEVVEKGEDRPGASELREAAFLVRRSPSDRERLALLEVFLGAGEAETLVVGQEVAADLVLIDDLRARQAAEAAGLRVVGVAGFLLAAKHAGHLEAVRPLLELLANRGFRLSKALVDEVARTAGEE